MSRRRFFASSDNITGSAITLSQDETHHLTHVLRMTPGDQAFVFNGCGNEYKCVFRGISDGRALLEITEALTNVVESPLDLTLAQSLVKSDKFDFIIQKATELGVQRIIPLITRYSDIKLEEHMIERRVERWRRISLEALKQCGRRRLVEITTPRTLQQFIDESGPIARDEVVHAASLRNHRDDTTDRKLAACATLLLFSESGGVAITKALEGIPNSTTIAALVGPEGGWSADELQLLTSRGAKSVSLGTRVLRTETAAIVAVALIQHLVGDLSAQVFTRTVS
jgi:16S rRNA (uracil1498-N3)-methyltransferase